MNKSGQMEECGQAEIVIIGGGAVGCGVAYSLSQAGKTDVIVLEKGPSLAAATTSQAAGLVGQVRDSLERTRLAMWSVRTFSELQKQEANPSWRPVGSLRVALTDERVDEFVRMKAVADEAGLETRFIEPGEAGAKWPVMDFTSSKSILWCPTDGYLQPHDLTMAYRASGRIHGIRYSLNTQVQDILQENGHISGVVTNQGKIECRTVINAAGAHAYQIAKLVGLELPIVPVRHEYLVTIQCDGIEPTMPVIRIPDASLYMRAEVNSVLLGGWESRAVSHSPEQIALEQEPPGIEPDWDVLAEFVGQLKPLLPEIENLGIRSVFKGWPTFTPDGRFIIGPSRRVPGFVMAGGCNAHGVSGSAGIGRHVVESMSESEPSSYVRSLSPDRFDDQSWNWQSARARAESVYGGYYAIHS